MDATPPDGGLPTLAQLAPGWNELRPGGDTICGDGTPWAFYARRGTVNRVLIEYQGGGGGWNELTTTSLYVGAGSMIQVFALGPGR